MKVIKKHFVIINIILLITTNILGQTIGDSQTFKEYADLKFQNLNKSIISTGILYDRMFPIADLTRFKKANQFSDTTNSRHFLQAYYELYNSSYNNNSLKSPELLDSELDINPNITNGVPIGVLNFKYNVIDSNAFIDNLLDSNNTGQLLDVNGRTRSPYLTLESFLASPIISDGDIFEEDQYYNFYLDSKFFIQNNNLDIKQIKIDFGDGQGEWIVNNPFSSNILTRSSILHSITKKIGKILIGRITVIGIDIVGAWVTYGNPFKIFARPKKEKYSLTPCKGGFSGGVKWVIEPDANTLTGINSTYNNPILSYQKKIDRRYYVNVKDTAYFFFSNDGNNCNGRIVKRPIIFIDGFDPTNSRDVGMIYENYINQKVSRNGTLVSFGDYLSNNGTTNPNDDYDLIILDFKHGNDLIERNAMTLVALIDRLNKTYGNSYLQDITLIGPSMGSLIAQYALSYMEKNHIEHKVKTFISFDGPHQGANVPIGIQNYIEYISSRGILKGINLIREGLYNGLAAKQMIAHHHSANSQFPAPSQLRSQFLQNLSTVGEYPQLCRKVAIINGAKNGILNPNHSTNSTLIDIEINRGGWKSLWGLCDNYICKKIKWIARTSTNSTLNKTTEMWTASPLYNTLFWLPLGTVNYYTEAAWGGSSLDNAPGGLIGNVFSENFKSNLTFWAKEMVYLITGDKPTFNININNFTMMPSYGAADIRYPNKNLYQRIDQCPPTPFDYIYAPSSNQEHVSINNESSFWFENEIKNILPNNTNPSMPVINREFNSEDCFSMNLTVSPTNSSCYNWEVTGDLLLNGANQNLICGSNSVTVSSMSGHGGSISVRYYNGVCYSSTKQLCFDPCLPWNNPNFQWIYSSPMTGEPLQAQVNSFPNALYYQWFINGQLIETTSSPFLSTYNWPCIYEGSGLTVYAVTDCGRTVGINGGNYWPICYNTSALKLNIDVYPNPAKSDVTVAIKNKESFNKENKIINKYYLNQITEIRIFTKTGILKNILYYTKGSKNITLKIDNYPPDIYYLEVSDGTRKVRTSLIIK